VIDGRRHDAKKAFLETVMMTIIFVVAVFVIFGGLLAYADITEASHRRKNGG
jgi:hypothetical protein